MAVIIDNQERPLELICNNCKKHFGWASCVGIHLPGTGGYITNIRRDDNHVLVILLCDECAEKSNGTAVKRDDRA